MKKTVALLMPALNEEKSVAKTMDSIFNSTRLPDEIIVADGGSTDNTKELVRTYSDKGVTLTIVDNPGVYAGAGRNAAFAVSSSDILMLMDFGNTMAPDWIELMAKPFEEEELDFVSGTYLPDADSDYEKLVAAIIYHNNSLLDLVPIEELMKRLPKTHEPGALSLAVSRQMWKKVDGMPSWLRAAEDKLFGRKMMDLDPKYRLLPQARIRHHMRSSPKALFKQMFTYARGNGRTLYFRPEIIRLALLYLVATLLVIGTYSYPIAWAFYTAMLGAYVWKSGVTKADRIGHSLPFWKLHLMAALVVIPRDLGTLLGFISGLSDWAFKSPFKLKLKHYFSPSTKTEIG